MIKVTLSVGTGVVVKEFHGAGVIVYPNGILAVETPAGAVVFPAGEWENVEHEEDEA